MGTPQTRETNIESSSRRRRINPKLIAPIAFLVAFTAIALEIAYAIGHFFMETAEKIR